MFKRISIILLILFTLLAFTVGANAQVTMVKASDDSYIRWMSGAVIIFEINETGTTLGGTVDYSQTILMETTDAIQWRDTGLYINSTSDGILTINSDGTLVTTVTTSSTLYTPTYVHGFDSSNKVTTTVSSTGTVKVVTTGASTGTYEIETDDGAIVLDAAAGISLDSGSGVTTLTGDLNGSNAAGPAIIDEAATSINPTLVPNKAEETSGIGWVSSGVINVVIGGTSVLEFSSSGIDMNGNGLTELGTVAGTKPITITPDATATTYLDFVLEPTWLGGTLIDMNWGSSATLSASVVFINIDSANVDVGSEENVTGIDINLPQVTYASVTKTHKGIEITAQGAFILSGGNAITWTGIDITIPAITQTAGTVTASGQLITGSAITTGGTVYGLRLAGVFTTGIQIGLTGTKIDLVEYTDRALEIYVSSDATGGTVMPLYVEMVSTGAIKARAAEFVLAPTAKMGQWANAVKAYLNLDNASGADGTAAALCAEVLVPDTTMTGHLFVLELEMVAPATGHVYGETAPVGRLAFILMQLSGTDIDEIETYGSLMTINGLTDGTGNIWFDNTLRIAVDGTSWYIPLSSAQASYTTTYPIDVTVAGGTAIDIGTSTIGINFSGTYEQGIRFTEDMVAGVNNSFINIGTYGSAIAVALSGANMFGVMQNVSLTDINVAYWYQAYYTKITTSGTTTDTSIAGHALRLVIGSDLDAVYGIQSHVVISGARTFTSEVTAGSFYLDVGSNTISNVGSRVNALQAVLVGSSTVTSLFFNVASFTAATNANTDSLVHIGQGASSITGAAIEFYLDGTATLAFEFNGTVPDSWTTADITGGDEMGAFDEYVIIPIKVAGVTGTLYIMAAETWKNVGN